MTFRKFGRTVGAAALEKTAAAPYIPITDAEIDAAINAASSDPAALKALRDRLGVGVNEVSQGLKTNLAAEKANARMKERLGYQSDVIRGLAARNGEAFSTTKAVENLLNKRHLHDTQELGAYLDTLEDTKRATQNNANRYAGGDINALGDRLATGERNTRLVEGLGGEAGVKGLEQHRRTLQNLANKHTKGNIDALSDFLETGGRAARTVENAGGEHTLLENLKRLGRYDQIVQEAGGESALKDIIRKRNDVFTLPKPKLKHLGIGGGIAALGTAGLYGLHRLSRNDGDYAFLDE